MYTNVNELLEALRQSLAEHPAEHDALKAIATIARRDGLEAGIAAYEAWKQSRLAIAPDDAAKPALPAASSPVPAHVNQPDDTSHTAATQNASGGAIDLSDATRLKRWLLRYCTTHKTDHVTCRNARNYGPIREKERFFAAANQLTENGDAWVEKDGQRHLLRINPTLLHPTFGMSSEVETRTKTMSTPIQPAPTQPAHTPSLQLRDYQQRALDQLYDWFVQHKGNPCIVLPTGAGKSHVVAALCKDALTQWPETKILMLTHVKELIEQNLEKLLLHWPNAPVGVYSASVGRKELGHPITYAGIQSIWRRAEDVGHVDLVVIDEAHLVSHKDTGMYRTFLSGLTQINPRLRVVGLTATPFRLGHGLITDPPAIFSKPLIKPASLTELIAKGYLAPLWSKATDTTYDVSGVAKRNGDYVESELQAAVDKDDLNRSVVDEIIARAGNRRSWLVFCTGVKHAEHIAAELRERGVEAACINGETPKTERERLIGAFKAGKIRALTNANVLTTGFDHPDVDLIAMLRPTESPGLYVQMAGRGLRPKSHTDHCLVLDFAGIVERHGPITAVEPPEKNGNGSGRPPVKKCPQCRELVHARVKECPVCGYDFPPAERTVNLWLRDADIMGDAVETHAVTRWYWMPHRSGKSGRWLLMGEYHLPSRFFITQYLTLFYPGFPGRRAQADLEALLGEPLPQLQGSEQEKLEELAKILNQKPAPFEISFVRDGNFFRIISAKWRLL